MRRSWVDSGDLSAVPAVHYTAVDGRLRYRSAARLLPSQSLSSFAIPFDSRSPSLKGDILSLQLWGDIILEQEHKIEASDDTFKDAGKVGFWTKADSVTYFDDLKVKAK